MSTALLEKPTGMKYPFRISSKGGIAKTDGSDKVIANLIALAKSSVNERIIRKSVGTIGYKVLFQPGINSDAKLIESLVFEAITRFEPRAAAVQVQVRTADVGATHFGFIDVSFVFRNTGDPATFTVTV